MGEVNKMKKSIAITILVLILIWLFVRVVFIVPENSQAVVLQLGKIVRVIKTPGLKFKLPSPIQSVVFFEKRLMYYDSPPTEVITKDKKTLIVDSYATWRIVDPKKFLISVKNINGAEVRLDDIIYSELRVDLGSYELSNIISKDRETIMKTVTAISNKKASEFGIEIVDVRLKRADLPKENEKAVFNRMKSERQRQAKKYRSEGMEEAAKIKAETDKQVKIIMADAYKKAEILRGEGDAEAIKIYAEAYGQDPIFYKFLRSLEAYKNAFKGGASFILSRDSKFLEIFTEKFNK